MRKFTIPCDFGGIKEPFDVYIGNSDPNYHPLYYQAMWLKKDRGCIIPADVMESFAKLKKLSEERGVSFEELCEYAFKVANEETEDESKDTK
jgi:hypothetical protein